MKHKGPIITLAAGLVLAAILMVMNLSVTKNDDASAGDGGPPATTAPAPTPTTQTTGVAQPPATAQVTYAGNVQGGGATVAIAVKDGKAVAYLCDGRRTEAWLQGSASNGELLLTGAGNARLDGAFGNGVASGTIIASGTRWAFSVKVVKPPSGLYRATANVRGARVVGGWIVVDGQQVGLLQVDGATQEAPALNTTTNSVIVNGTQIDADPVDGTGL